MLRQAQHDNIYCHTEPVEVLMKLNFISAQIQ